MIVNEGLRHKAGKAEVLQGGVIVDVSSAAQAVMAEQAGACAVRVVALSDSAFSPVALIRRVMNQISIPVMAQVSIGHFVEARILQELEVDFIDEAESLRPADEDYFIDKRDFEIPFLSGAENLGEALRRITEGAALIRPLSPRRESSLSSDVRLLRTLQGQIKRLSVLPEEELYAEAKALQAPNELVEFVARNGRLPVPIVSSASISSPADAALMRHIGAGTLFVSHAVFSTSDPLRLLRAVIRATAGWEDPAALVAACEEAGAVTPLDRPSQPQVPVGQQAATADTDPIPGPPPRVSGGLETRPPLPRQPLVRRVAASSRPNTIASPRNFPRKPQR